MTGAPWGGFASGGRCSDERFEPGQNVVENRMISDRNDASFTLFCLVAFGALWYRITAAPVNRLRVAFQGLPLFGRQGSDKDLYLGGYPPMSRKQESRLMRAAFAASSIAIPL